MTRELKTAVGRLAAAGAAIDGLHEASPLDGVTLIRADAPTGLIHAVYRPVLCLVLGGAKQVATGDAIHLVRAGQSVIVSTDVPVVARIVAASPSDPYLALALDLDWATIRAVAAEMGPTPSPPARPAAVLSDETDAALVDGASRLIRLLERPDAIPVLRPAIVREMVYWLLAGRHGGALRSLAALDSHAVRIARAVALLRAAFDQPLPVERLAAVAGMSASSFHQHFKALTSLSPRQFQKHLRLLEARRLMVAEGLNVSRAALAVGYESVSQFTRDYGRLFGAPPRRDSRESRAA